MRGGKRVITSLLSASCLLYAVQIKYLIAKAATTAQQVGIAILQIIDASFVLGRINIELCTDGSENEHINWNIRQGLV